MTSQPGNGVEQEAARAHDVPWGLLDCVGVIAVTLLAIVLLLTALTALDAAVGLPEETQHIFLPLPLVTLALVTLLWVHLRQRAVHRLTGPARGSAREWVLGVGLGVASFVAVNLLLGTVIQVGARIFDVDLAYPQPGLREAAMDPELLPWLALSAVVIAPASEELFFRGMLFQALLRRTGRWTAVITSALVFAGAHVVTVPTWRGGPVLFALVLPLGAFLAWLFDRRGTLSTPIAVHAVFNGVTLAVMLWAAGEGIMAGG